MDVDEAKARFVEQWGKMASDWGVNRCMAQVHAVLLLAEEPLDTENVMDELCISRGSANMNIRALIDWGLVHKKLISGERKDFFVAEKDIWEAFKKIVIARKKKELDPLKETLEELKTVEGEEEEAEQFRNKINDLLSYANKSEKALDTILKLERNWLHNPLFRI